MGGRSGKNLFFFYAFFFQIVLVQGGGRMDGPERGSWTDGRNHLISRGVSRLDFGILFLMTGQSSKVCCI